MPFGSVLANAKEVTFTTADDKIVTLKGRLQRLGLRLLGIPHMGLRVRARAVVPLLNAKPGDTVLDAGCGTGVYSFHLAFDNIKVYGVDADRKKIERCAKMSEQLGTGNYTYFFKEDLTKLSFDNNLFDKILCSEVLEHIKDHKKAINELHRVLKPGGELVISVPYDTYLNKKYLEAFGHYRLYTIETMQKLLNSHFEIISIARRNRFLGQIAWMLNRKMFFSKILAAITFVPLYLLTYIDFWGQPRELIVKARKK